MKIVKSIDGIRSWRKKEKGSVGFVPTMGALHDGHLYLIREARKNNDFVVVSIFVNPTQFNDSKDCQTYPQPIGDDLEKCRLGEVDCVFMPQRDDLYPDDYHYKISEDEISTKMEGEFRPGHFDGVLTVVMKLLQLTKPTRAYFGEKDWQQLKLIEGMVDAFFLETKIISCPTLRETDGLAMSSRNIRLDSQSRTLAPQFYKILENSATSEETKAKLIGAGFEVEYVQDDDKRRLAAVSLAGVRLIDNISLEEVLS